MIRINFKFYPWFENNSKDESKIDFIPLKPRVSRSSFISPISPYETNIPLKITSIWVRDYFKTPGGKEDGEIFYQTVLKPVFERTTPYSRIHIDLDGCYGYPSSFLDAVFGNLCFDFGLQKVIQRTIIVSNDQPGLIDYIISHMNKVDIEKERKTKDGF